MILSFRLSIKMAEVIFIDTSCAATILDIMAETKRALGSPEWHGGNVNAFIDSIVYGGINRVSGFSQIIFGNTEALDKMTREELVEFANDINEAAFYANKDIRIMLS